MNRVIIFRGVDVNTGEFRFGDYASDFFYEDEFRGEVYSKDENGDTHFILENLNKPFEVKGETVGQFTGLKDKNGIEIYEGDVVMCYPNQIEHSYLKVVEWDNNSPSLGITTNGRSGATLCKNNQDILEVVGNIHKNPELLPQMSV